MFQEVRETAQFVFQETLMAEHGRVFNFSAGPSMMPLPVLEEAARDMFNYKGTGQSVMEMSHRSSEFKEIIENAESDLRELLSVPDNYKVLFLQGGGTLQFSMVPLNLMTGSGKADYVITGNWANKAYEEALKFGDARDAASSADDNFSYIPETAREDFREDADYVYVCWNNTIFGTHYSRIPDTGDIPLVADMSSCFLSEEVDVGKFGLIWAGAQKNVGPAGLVIVIIREDLTGRASADTPVYLDYAVHAEKGSLYNTPPCYPIYIAGLVFQYLKRLGGISAVHDADVRKARKLYDYLDSTDFYRTSARSEDRSLMNVVFATESPELDSRFVSQARERGLINLKGHRLAGGLRASIYNAMPEEGVDALIRFMEDFEKGNR